MQDIDLSKMYPNREELAILNEKGLIEIYRELLEKRREAKAMRLNSIGKVYNQALCDSCETVVRLTEDGYCTSCGKHYNNMQKY